MTHYCKYHVLELADWHCAGCRINFCSTCSPDIPGEESATHYCPLCNGELLRLSASHTAVPFWQCLNDFLRYPFSLLGAICLALSFLVPLLVGDSHVVAYGAAALVLLAVVKYAWTALENVANGESAPIGVDKLLKAENNEVAIGVGIIMLLCCGAIGYIFSQSSFYGSLVAALAVMAAPAMLVAAGNNRSAASALAAEPLKSALAGIGPVYVAVALLALLLLGALQSFVAIFADILPLAWGRAMALTAYSYFTIALFALSGHLLFQYQERLGFTPSGGARRRVAKRVDTAQVTMEMMLKEGNYARAKSLLRNETQKKGATLTAHERYHRMIWALKDDEALRQHANVYFKVLLEAGRDSEVASLMRAYNQRIPGFRPDDPEVCYDMAFAFERLGDYKLAVHAVSGMHKDSPNYVHLPEMYLLAARLLAQKLGLPQKALGLLQFLEGRFKTHKTYPEIQKLLRAVSTAARPA